MKSFYITTPIYYINDSPHIGHAYTTIACDIISRYNKLLGNDVYFLSGTDEHGQKVQNAAKKTLLNPQKFADKMSANFRDLIKFLNCEINDFIRTTESRHIIASQALWNKLLNNNQIYLSNYEGWYSVRDEAFYSENELIKRDDKYIAPSGAEVEWIKEESYFFKLSEWENKLIDFYTNNPEAIKPLSRFNEVMSFIKGGLKDLSISRTTFKWGIPVPNDDSHVMYVWIDALCNYLTSIGYPDTNSENFAKFWPGYHVVGKDILRFHSVYWPAFLMAADLQPPKRVFAHGWWTNEGEKISKSLGNIIDPYEVVSKYGLDQIRFFLFREVPFGSDGNFSKDSIAQRINADLSNNFGNLVRRICSFINKNCNSIVSKSANFTEEDNKLLELSINKFIKYNKFMKEQNIYKSLQEIFDLLTETNIYVDKQAPWILKNTNAERMHTVLFVALEIIRRSSLLLFPVIPDSCNKIFSILNIDKINIKLQNYEIPPSDTYNIQVSYPIFPRLDKND